MRLQAVKAFTAVPGGSHHDHYAAAHADWALQTAGAGANGGPAPGALAGASMGADVGHDHIDFAPMHFAHMWD
jgi:hypothetical protein